MADVPFWLEVAGRLGPVSIAAAVFITNLQQTRRSNLIGQRAARVEDQKLRLALLERRLTAIEAVRTANYDFMVAGAVTQPVAESISTSLRVAQLVFDEDVRMKLQACYEEIHVWLRHKRRIDAIHRREFSKKDDDKRLSQLVDDMMESEDRIVKILPELLELLISASRVEMVPLPAMSFFARRLAKR